ncbi:hypothetical protein ACFP1Z_18925 [Streptomyces gamaensis]|uniref:Uncharacterized protein n=1 Tax=Streptomyces gamaensis TaxID=1763542 RepID=A0ABW0Z079_9ACTN
MTGKDSDTVVGSVAGATVVAASVDTGRTVLKAHDAFVDQQSPFDRQARLNLRPEVATVTVDAYLDYVANQVIPWTDDETAALRDIATEINTLFASWSFTLPPEVRLVKTTGQEEGRAAYTRHVDTIVIPAGKVETLLMASPDSDPLFPARNTTSLRNILIHEFFHLISKNNQAQRDTLYRSIGYTRLDSPVQLPDVPWPDASSKTSMPALKITNPDTPLLDVRISLDVPKFPGEGPESGTVTRELLPVLLAKGPYEGGNFFQYLQWYFMAIEQSGDAWIPVLDAGGRPLMYLVPNDPDPKPAWWDQYLQKIGRNTDSELFHPDEVIAQNFVFSALLPTPELLAGIDRVLTK